VTPLVSVKDHVILGSLGLLAIMEQVRVVDWPTAILVCVAVTLTSGGTVRKHKLVYELYITYFMDTENM